MGRKPTAQREACNKRSEESKDVGAMFDRVLRVLLCDYQPAYVQSSVSLVLAHFLGFLTRQICLSDRPFIPDSHTSTSDLSSLKRCISAAKSCKRLETLPQVDLTFFSTHRSPHRRDG